MTPIAAKIPPKILCNHFLTNTRENNFCLSLENVNAYIKLIIVPEIIKQVPSDNNCSHTFPRAGSINCGRKVMKKIPTFGFNNVLMIPRRKALNPESNEGEKR